MAIDDPRGSLRAPAVPDTGALVAAVDALPVRDGEDPWTFEEIEALATELTSDAERLRAELLAADAELSSLLRDSGEGAGDDQADSGSSALEREHELTLVRNTRDLLDQTLHALERLTAAGFGTCESCNGPIGKARLQAFPRATLCVTCKAQQERR